MWSVKYNKIIFRPNYKMYFDLIMSCKCNVKHKKFSTLPEPLQYTSSITSSSSSVLVIWNFIAHGLMPLPVPAANFIIHALSPHSSVDPEMRPSHSTTRCRMRIRNHIAKCVCLDLLISSYFRGYEFNFKFNTLQLHN